MVRSRPLLMLVGLLAALLFQAADANARAGGGSSFGSRGMRTFSPPAATQTAPNAAAPIERSMTQRAPSTSPTTGGWFGRPGLFGGLAAGFLGAGLFGLLFGHGLFGGLGGFASVFGLLLQLALIFFVARLIWGWYQRRHAPAYAGGASMLRGTIPGDGAPAHHSGGTVPFAGAPGRVSILKADYDAFERLLGEVQTAYTAEDLGILRNRVTPEMLSYFAEDLAANAGRGVANRVSDVKLLQGDLAEAWREGDAEFATVAMRFSLVDQMVDRASGRVLEGDPAVPTEATELWTFRRASGGPWMLSAIQQPA